MDHGYSNIEKGILDHLKQGETPYLGRLQKNNKIILHNYEVAVDRSFACELEGCRKSHTVRLIPDQVLYPRYCEDHRTEHRRHQFLAVQSRI